MSPIGDTDVRFSPLADIDLCSCTAGMIRFNLVGSTAFVLGVLASGRVATVMQLPPILESDLYKYLTLVALPVAILGTRCGYRQWSVAWLDSNSFNCVRDSCNRSILATGSV